MTLTYENQPDNIGAWKLGRACGNAARHRAGDEIDRGLALLLELQVEGFGIVPLDAKFERDPAQRHHHPEPPVPLFYMAAGTIHAVKQGVRVGLRLGEDGATAAACMPLYGHPAVPHETLPCGWVTMWPAPGGGHEPIYTPGSKRPGYGEELDARLVVYPVYVAPPPTPPTP